jgi:hypothetical protein
MNDVPAMKNDNTHTPLNNVWSMIVLLAQDIMLQGRSNENLVTTYA